MSLWFLRQRPMALFIGALYLAALVGALVAHNVWLFVGAFVAAGVTALAALPQASALASGNWALIRRVAVTVAVVGALVGAAGVALNAIRSRPASPAPILGAAETTPPAPPAATSTASGMPAGVMAYAAPDGVALGELPPGMRYTVKAQHGPEWLYLDTPSGLVWVRARGDIGRPASLPDLTPPTPQPQPAEAPAEAPAPVVAPPALVAAPPAAPASPPAPVFVDAFEKRDAPLEPKPERHPFPIESKPDPKH